MTVIQKVESKAQPNDGQLLWRHQAPEKTQMWDFLQRINRNYHLELQTYDQLYDWSTVHTAEIWAEIWDFCGVRHTQPYDYVIEDGQAMWPRPRWFEGARLNFAENLLFPDGVHEDGLAVIAATEQHRQSFTWRELRELVRKCQVGMRAFNVQPGERIAAYVGNNINALVTMLAATSLGAIFTAVSTDTGVTAALDRLPQIEPKLFFADSVATYNGKTHSTLPRLREIIPALTTVKAAIIYQTSTTTEAALELPGIQVLTHEEFANRAEPTAALSFVQLPAEVPIYILYSSGTTGRPKCIVHGAIGALLQHKKEHIIQSDVRPGDRFFQFTTTNWMMWHWHVSALASGATVILYDGSPFYYTACDDQIAVKDYYAMPKLIEELGVTQFGTSASFLSVLQQNRVMPRDQLAGRTLRTLRAVYSTGSPLSPSTFQYVYDAFGPDIHLGSITGGTDIIADFGTPSPLKPVYAGEVQCLGLGMAVRVFDPDGNDISTTGQAGELVCVKPFPSQPIRFWGPSGEALYKAAYFEQYPGLWAHGDYIRFNPRTRGMIMLGRSDGVLKPNGVRFGSAEIYNLLLKHFDTVEDSLCVGRRRPTDADESVVLFLKMRDQGAFGVDLVSDIRSKVKTELSPRYILHEVETCPAIPVTANGKKVEKSVKQILSGAGAKVSANVVNPACLDFFHAWAQAH